MKNALLRGLVVFGLSFCLAACGTETTDDVTNGNGHSDVPEFPWPPPHASASAIIPSDLVEDHESDATNLGHVDQTLAHALDAAGYAEVSYFSVPNGFALVTRLERIECDGTPKEPGRWSPEIEHLGFSNFSLRDYLINLFTADPGLYRVIVFIVSPHPFSQSDIIVDRIDATDWLREGLNRLPTSISTLAYTEDFTTTALIYEFEQPESQEPLLKLPSHLSGRTHLDKSGLMGILEG